MTSLKLLLTCLILTLFNLNLAFSQISHDHSNTGNFRTLSCGMEGAYLDKILKENKLIKTKI